MTHIDWTQLNWFDAIILAIVALSIVISFFRGFLREFISLATWLVALLLAIKFATPLADLLQRFIHSGGARYIIAFGIIFVVVLILGIVVNGVVHGIIGRNHNLGVLDRFFGVLFGVARGILVVATILMFIHLSAFQRADWYKGSQLSPEFQPLSDWLHEFLPKRMQEMSKWMDNQTVGSKSQDSFELRVV